ncbi:hypothetical protein NDU88_007364 [Pleurodeles waltl]|uniref:Uncharacterized protein n=1 Tax=Pleurodeles waltl TaxID=8319 RepID=A0AAV7UPX2_PLEWA|nr:hypothetical protein NDU88_007364 [Pleurodeles waltl]
MKNWRRRRRPGRAGSRDTRRSTAGFPVLAGGPGAGRGGTCSVNTLVVVWRQVAEDGSAVKSYRGRVAPGAGVDWLRLWVPGAPW